MSLVFESGRFDFEVAEAAEACAWCRAITERPLAWRPERPEAPAARSWASEASEPVEAPALREAWAECVRAVAQGGRATARLRLL